MLTLRLAYTIDSELPADMRRPGAATKPITIEDGGFETEIKTPADRHPFVSKAFWMVSGIVNLIADSEDFDDEHRKALTEILRGVADKHPKLREPGTSNPEPDHPPTTDAQDKET